METLKKILFILIIIMMFGTSNTFAVSSDLKNVNINGLNVKCVEINMNDKRIKPLVLNAKNEMNATDSLSSMAKDAGAFAAINGTYFEAYSGVPVPWGTIIKDGKVLHISQSGAVAGITSSGELLVDRLTFSFEGYINGVYRSIPWRINHPSTEPEAITIFTPEYGTTVDILSGSKGILVSKGYVIQITDTAFQVPNDGFAIVYNPSVSYLADERFKIGDEVYYKVKINTTFTEQKDWDDVIAGIGAGPSLIINGNITADGEIEGFNEAKINTDKAARSFIGSKEDGKIIIGNISSATVKEAANICKNMDLVNAMCLDGGGSVALYYPSSDIYTEGRNINNGLAFIEEKNVGITADPISSNVLVNGIKIDFSAYNINDNNYFKLRDIAMALNESDNKFDVQWDENRNVINIITQNSYTPIGDKLIIAKINGTKIAYLTSAGVYIDGVNIFLTSYSIDGNNYFKLRDIADALNFSVYWDELSNTITVETDGN